MLTEEEALALAHEVVAGKSRSYVGAAKFLAEYVIAQHEAALMPSKACGHPATYDSLPAFCTLCGAVEGSDEWNARREELKATPMPGADDTCPRPDCSELREQLTMAKTLLQRAHEPPAPSSRATDAITTLRRHFGSFKREKGMVGSSYFDEARDAFEVLAQFTSAPDKQACACVCRCCAEGDHCGESRPLGLGVCTMVHWEVEDRVRTVGVRGGLGKVIGVGGHGRSDLHVKLDDEKDPIWLSREHAAKVDE